MSRDIPPRHQGIRGSGKTLLIFEEVCDAAPALQKLMDEMVGKYPRPPGMSEIVHLLPPSAFEDRTGQNK